MSLDTSDARMRTHLPALSIFGLVLAAALLPHASAQAPRNGVRLEYTALDTQGGQSGRAFLPLSSSNVAVGDDALDVLTPCRGALRVRATARQTRGAIRQVRLTLAVRAPATLPMDSGACPGAYVDTTLEDGTVLSGGRGEVVVTSIVLPGRVAGVVVGHFAQTAMRGETPVTIRGEFRIPLPTAGGGAHRGPLGS